MTSNVLQSLGNVVLGGSIGFVALNLFKGNDRFYECAYGIGMPILHRFIDPETAHHLAVKIAAKYRIGTRLSGSSCQYANLGNSVWNLSFESPIGLAAGFDENGEAVVGLADIGFSFVEVGSITPQPQYGNERPRVDKSIINRYGFNNEGLMQVKHNLCKARANLPHFIIGVNLGKNKTSEDAVSDYTSGLAAFAHIGSYFVINISSPNTPGLRQLQNKQELNEFLSLIQAYRKSSKGLVNRPLLVKIAPDLTIDQEQEIAQLLLKHKVNGLIVSNTTIRRQMIQNKEHSMQSGGLSGLAVRDLSTAQVGRMYKLTKGQIPIIGVGGVFTGADAYDKIRAGASLVQLYTSLAYEGPTLVNRVKRELSKLIDEDGYENIKEAPGVDKNKY